MKVTNKFTIAIHIILVLDLFGEKEKITSEKLAKSTNMNSVIIRQILSKLKAAGFVEINRGFGGARLITPLNTLSLFDVLVALGEAKTDFFNFHSSPSPDCPVGRHIHDVLDDYLINATKAMENYMKSVTLDTLSHTLRTLYQEDQNLSIADCIEAHILY